MSPEILPEPSREEIEAANRRDYPGWPPELIKAAQDNPFDYACGLRDGSIIYFAGAAPLDDGWIHLDIQEHFFDVNDREQGDGPLSRIPLDRGIDIRLSEILWVADAPYGS